MASYIIIYEHMYIIGPTFVRINLSKYTLTKYILSGYNFLSRYCYILANQIFTKQYFVQCILS